MVMRKTGKPLFVTVGPKTHQEESIGFLL